MSLLGLFKECQCHCNNKLYRGKNYLGVKVFRLLRIKYLSLELFAKPNYLKAVQRPASDLLLLLLGRRGQKDNCHLSS